MRGSVLSVRISGLFVGGVFCGDGGGGGFFGDGWCGYVYYFYVVYIIYLFGYSEFFYEIDLMGIIIIEGN